MIAAFRSGGGWRGPDWQDRAIGPVGPRMNSKPPIDDRSKEEGKNFSIRRKVACGAAKEGTE
jgi:hypothetical protein